MPHLRERSEEGSIIVAMTMIAVLSLLAAAVLARTVSGQDSTRDNEDFSSALGAADAGVSDMLFRLDQIGDGTPTDITVTSVPGAPGTQYTAEYDLGTDAVTVRSRGTVNGRPHGVSAVIKRSRVFPFAIFGVGGLAFNGNGGGQIVPVDEDGNQITDGSVTADAGTNGNIECQSGGGGQSNIAYPGGSVEESCDFATHLDAGTYSPQPPVVIDDCSTVEPNVPRTPCGETGSMSACPAVGGVITGTVAPGRYLCTSSIQIGGGYVQVGAGNANGGIVEIFVIPPTNTAANVTLGTNGSGGKAYVNVSPDALANNESDDDDGDPSKFRLYVAGGGLIDMPGGSNAPRFVGVLYAPESTMTGNGCHDGWRGSLIIYSVTCNGGPNLGIQYDVRVATLKDEDWHVDSYHEIPSSQVNV